MKTFLYIIQISILLLILIGHNCSAQPQAVDSFRKDGRMYYSYDAKNKSVRFFGLRLDTVKYVDTLLLSTTADSNVGYTFKRFRDSTWSLPNKSSVIHLKNSYSTKNKDIRIFHWQAMIGNKYYHGSGVKVPDWIRKGTTLNNTHNNMSPEEFERKFVPDKQKYFDRGHIVQKLK